MQRSSSRTRLRQPMLAFFRRPVFGIIQMLAALLMALPPSSFTRADEPMGSTITLWTDNGNTAVPGQVVPLYAQLRDASGSPLSGVTLYFSVTNGSGMLGMGYATTDWQGVCAVGFMGDGNSTTVTATDGYATDPSTGSCVITPSAPHTYGINWYADASSLSPGNSATVTAQLVDTTNGANTVVPGVVLNFSLPMGDGSLSSYSGTTDGNGCVTLGFTAGSSTAQINAWDAVGLGASSACTMEVASNTINPTTPTYSISLAADQNPLAQQQPTTLRSRVTDQNGSPVYGDTVYFQVVNGDATLGSLASQTDQDGWCSVPITSGTMPSQITVSDSLGYAAPNTLTLAVPTSGDTYSLSLVPGVNPLAPGTQTSITVTVRDETIGLPVSGAVLMIGAQSGGVIAESGGMSSATVTTLEDGTATVTLVGTDAPSNIMASCPALNLSQTLSVGVARRYNLSVSQSANSVPAYQPVTINVQVSDASTGQPVGGITPAFFMQSGSGWFDSAVPPTDDQGMTTVAFINDGSNATLGVTAPDDPASAQYCSIGVYTISTTGSMSVWADGNGSLLRGDSAAISAQVWDATGLPLNNGTVTFTVTEGDGTLSHEGQSGVSSLTAQTNSDGTCTIYLVGGTQLSNVSVSAPDTGDPVVQSFAVTPEFYELRVTQTGASTLEEGATCALNARVYNITRKAYTSSAPLTISVSGGGSVSIDPEYGTGTSGSTLDDGNCYATFTGGSSASTVTITSALDPVTVWTADFSVVQMPPPPSYQLTMNASPGTSVSVEGTAVIDCLLTDTSTSPPTPLPGVEVSFSVSGGDADVGSVEATAKTGPGGHCYVTYTGGSAATTVTASETTYNTTSSLAFTVASGSAYRLVEVPPTEAWLANGTPTSLSFRLAEVGTAIAIPNAEVNFYIGTGDGRLRTAGSTTAGATAVTATTGNDGIATVDFLFGNQTTEVLASSAGYNAAAFHTFQKPTGTTTGGGGTTTGGGGTTTGGGGGGGGNTQTASLVGVQSRVWSDNAGSGGRAPKEEDEPNTGGDSEGAPLRVEEIARYEALKADIDSYQPFPPAPAIPYYSNWEPVYDTVLIFTVLSSGDLQIKTGFGWWHYERHVHDPGEEGTQGNYSAENPRFAVAPDDVQRISIEGDNCTLRYTDDGLVSGTSDLMWHAAGQMPPDSSTVTARANNAFAIADFPPSEREKEGASTLSQAGFAQHRAETIYVTGPEGTVTPVVMPSGGHQMFWLTTSDGKEAVQDMTMTVLKTSGQIGHQDQQTVTPVQLTIKAGHKVSTEGGEAGVIRLAPTAGRFEGLSPVDIVAVFGHGALSGKALLDAHLSNRSEWKSIGADHSYFLVKGKPAGSKTGEKSWVVHTAHDEDSLKSGLSSASYVAFDGHANFGIGPAFEPAKIKEIQDFTNFGNVHAAIDWKYMKQANEYPNLNKIKDAQIAGNPDPHNYVVFPQRVNKERFPNERGVHPGETFSLLADGSEKYHYFLRANPQGSEWERYLIVDAGSADIPSLGYSHFFYNACYTARDYAEVFRAGEFFCSNAIINDDSEGTVAYVEAIIDGATDVEILEAINETQDANRNTGEPAFRLVHGPPN